MSSETTSTKKRAATSSSSTKDDMLNLTKSVNSLKKTQETFGKSVENMNQLLRDYFEDLELRIATKKRERQDLEEEYARLTKSAKIEIDQDLKAYGYDAAKKILSERKEVPICAEELKKLQEDLRVARSELKAAVDEAVKAANERSSRHLAHELKTRELEYSAKSANTDAALKQKDSEISVLQRTISDLRSEIEKQRALTEAVASASRPQYVPVASGSDRR